MSISICGRTIDPPKWTRDEAIDLCKQIEAFAPEFGCHVALTGGLLYKDGPRKDADIMLYRIRQASEINVEGLFAALKGIGVVRGNGVIPSHPGGDPTYIGIWVQKAKFNGKNIDFLFPDEPEPDDEAFTLIEENRY